MDSNETLTKSLYRLTIAPAWSDSASRSGWRSLSALLMMMVLAPPMWAQSPGTPPGAIPKTFAGMSINSNNHSYPPSGTDFGLLRLWDTPGTSWPSLQGTQGASLSTTNLDQVLKDAYSNSPNHQAVVMYTFGRVPTWASGSSDSNCAYSAGQCYPPSDINQDGSGADSYWSSFIVALANHLNGLSTTQYAQVKYFEPWNEIDRSGILANDNSNISYNGTYAQLLRMTEDMRCILLGKNYQATIHGTGLACSYSTGLMPGVKIVAPSSHAQGSNYLTATSIEMNFLHCDGTNGPKSGSHCTWSLSSPYGSNAVDIINFHMKPGNEQPGSGATDPESEMQTEYNNATAVYESPDTGKALWNGESGYSGASPCGWTPNPTTGDVDLNSYPGQQAAFVGRYLLIMWSLGIQNNNWYQWDNSNFMEGSCSGGSHTNGSTTDAGVAYSTVAKWMIGATMQGNPGCTASGTLWTCTLKNGTWTGLVLWDTASLHQCHGSDPNPCTTYMYTVGSTYKYYQTAIGSVTTLNTPYQVPVSNLPVIAMTSLVPKALK
jgi:hypothetical protein